MKYILFISLGITTVIGQEIAFGKSAAAVGSIDSKIFPLQGLNGHEADHSYPLHTRVYRLRREASEAVREKDHIEDLKGAETGANPYPYLAYRSNLDYQRYGYPNYRYQPNRHRYWGLGHKHRQAARCSTHHKHRDRRRTGCQAGRQAGRSTVGRREAHNTMGRCVQYGLIAGAVIGAVVAILGGILFPVGDMIIEKTVEKEAVIENGTTAFDNWVSTGAPVYRQFWLFNVENPEEVLKNGSIPMLTQKGPYTYRTRYLPKENITFNPNQTVSFELPMGAIFEPSMSVGPEEDRVTSLNLAVAGGYTLLPHALLNIMMRSSGSSLFQNRTVKEMLWGYHDPMLKSTLGLFVPYNGTFDGPYNVYNGKEDISKVGIIDRWCGERTLTVWNDTYCDMINGTDASSFPPFVDKKKPLYFFSSDICRSVSAGFAESMNLKGIEVYRYTLQPNTLAAPSVNPDNKCYCKDPIVTKNCTMAGVLDIRSCRDGTPIYISLPHFLHGSPSLRETVLGLDPIEDQHVTFLDVEPITGFTLRFAKRLQVNMMYGPSREISDLSKVKDYTIFPVVWLNETAAVDDETADMFKKKLTSRIQMLETVQQVLLGVGVVVFVLCLTCYCIVSRRDQSNIA